MKPFLLLITLFCISFSFSQDLIAVQNGDEPEFFTDLHEAIVAAQPNDTIYIPGRNYTVNDTIRKPLHFVGTGINPLSSTASGVTALSKNSSRDTQLVFDTNSGGSSIHGIYFTNSGGGGPRNIEIINPISTLTISRSNLSHGMTSFVNVSEINLIQSITHEFDIENCQNVFIANSIFMYLVNQINNAVITNSIFLQGSSVVPSLSGGENLLIKNSIFRSAAVVSNSVLFNNINVRETISSNINLNNFSSVNIVDVFINWTPSTNIDSFDLHLIENSPYATAGTDGTPIGIYGGPFPWKDSMVPFNPHVEAKNISSGTDENGNVQVEITVSAQSN